MEEYIRAKRLSTLTVMSNFLKMLCNCMLLFSLCITNALHNGSLHIFVCTKFFHKLRKFFCQHSYDMFAATPTDLHCSLSLMQDNYFLHLSKPFAFSSNFVGSFVHFCLLSNICLHFFCVETYVLHFTSEQSNEANVNLLNILNTECCHTL